MKQTSTPRPARVRRPAAGTPAGASRTDADAVVVRPVRRGDMEQVIAIDAAVTGLERAKYWTSVYRRYGSGRQDDKQFLVALARRRVVGFVIGEVRDWEFGWPPCGWVFAIEVDPRARQGGIGTRLLEVITEGFRQAGVSKVRALLSRDNTLILSFFRSQGMMAGPLLSLEMDIDR